MRYTSVKRKKDSNGNRIVSTAIIPKIPRSNNDTFVMIVERTRLDHLAYKFYKNPEYWWVIANANNINGTMYAKLGSQIRIPMNITQIIAEYNRINEMQ